MRRTLIGVLVLVVLAGGATAAAVLALRDDDGTSAGPILVTPRTGIMVQSAQSTSATPVARLPGITVVGLGEVEVKPDVAMVRLTVGSGSSFDSDEMVELIDEKELEPVVDALVDAGAPRDEIYVDTFGGLGYGPSTGSATITFTWPRPHEVKKALAAAQVAVRKRTDHNLQQIAVVFAREACDEPERKAMDAALKDARARAERLASLSGAKLGRLLAVSEASSLGVLAAFAPGRCGADTLQATAFLDYGTSIATADEVKVNASLEVTFALEP